MKNINIAAILDKYSRNDGYTSIKDLYQNESVDEIVYGDFIDSVEAYLDNNCANGFQSRWTNFGYALFDAAVDFTDEIIELCKQAGETGVQS